MKTTIQLPSKYGPVDLRLIECDHCEARAQEQHLIGWCQMFPRIGIDIRTIGDYMPDEMHFCSLNHLKEYIKEHVQ